MTGQELIAAYVQLAVFIGFSVMVIFMATGETK